MFINPLRNCDEQGFNSSIVLSDWQVLIKKSWQDKFSRGWGWEDRVKNVIIFWDNDILVRTSKFIKVGGRPLYHCLLPLRTLRGREAKDGGTLPFSFLPLTLRGREARGVDITFQSAPCYVSSLWLYLTSP